MLTTAVYFVCLNSNSTNIAMTRLAILSLREKARYFGDVLIFSDSVKGWDGLGDRCRCIPVDCAEAAGDDEGIPWREDPRLFRILVNEICDLAAYDVVLYLDYDVLVTSNLAPVFAGVTDDALYFTYAARRPWVDPAYPDPRFLSPYLGSHFDLASISQSSVFEQSPTGICSGIFAMKGKAVRSLFSDWRQYVRQLVATGCAVTVQTALNELMLRGGISGKPFPNEWTAYPLSPLFGASDRRCLASSSQFVFHHFNPGKAAFKLVHMKNHYAFGSII